jgi:pyruvate-ferredoxin/flavodoxin oxidoreductase
VIPTAEAVADYLRETRRIKVGVVDPGDVPAVPRPTCSAGCCAAAGVTVLERVDQPLAVDLPLAREIRAALGKCLENGRANGSGRRTPACRPTQARDVPDLYSACFGLGSRDLSARATWSARWRTCCRTAPAPPVLPRHRLPARAAAARQGADRQERLAAIIRSSATAGGGSENPNLMPKDCVTVRMHSIGGWGAITTGKHLATTLFDLLGYHIKANPKYGSEKKGQPTTFYLAARRADPGQRRVPLRGRGALARPERVRHSNALAGLRDGGVFIIQSDAATPEQAWERIPERYRRQIVGAADPAVLPGRLPHRPRGGHRPGPELRMQGIAFQGAFFAATGLLAEHGLDEERLIDAMRERLQKKFGAAARAWWRTTCG